MVKDSLKLFSPYLYRLLALLKFDLMRGYDSLGSKEISLFRNVIRISPREMRLIKRDILDSFLRYGTTPLEYFLFGFPTISKRERASFLTDSYREELLIKIEG